MKIQKFQIGLLKSELKVPFQTSLKSTKYIDDVVLILKTNNGLTGFGSAAPTSQVTGETQGSLVFMIKEIISSLQDQEIVSLKQITQKIQNFCFGNYSAKNCVEIAIYDLFSQNLKLPLFQFLGGFKNNITTSVTISQDKLSKMHLQAKTFIQNDCTDFKIKMGKNIEDDLKTISEFSKKYKENCKFHIDPNQGWDYSQTKRFLKFTRENKIEIDVLEQPMSRHNIFDYQRLRKISDTPILLDESIFHSYDLMHHIHLKTLDMVNIKLAKCGGISNAQEMISIAKSAKIPCYLGCMLESHIAVTAAAHLACGDGSFIGHDLDPPLLLKKNPVKGGAIFQNNKIVLNEMMSGLGIQFIENLQIILE